MCSHDGVELLSAGYAVLHEVIHRGVAPPFPCRHPERWPRCGECADRDSCAEWWDEYHLREEEEGK